MSHIWTRRLDNLRGCKLKGNVALIRSLWQTLSINQQTFTMQHRNIPSYPQALLSVTPHWFDLRPPRRTRWFVSDQAARVHVNVYSTCRSDAVPVSDGRSKRTTSDFITSVSCHMYTACKPPAPPLPIMTVEYLQIGVSAPHLVPVCVNPLPSLQLSLLHCPSCEASLIATLRVMPLHVCAGVPQAGVHETGGVGGGSGGKNSLLPEGDSSPAATVKGTTGGWGETAAV